MLRLITYLTPSIPLELYEAVAAHLRGALGVPVALATETRFSGPPRGAPDPFSAGEADLGFLCAPAYLWLRERPTPPVELLGVAPVHRDPRNAGRPVYHTDLVVARGSPLRAFEDLDGRALAMNDESSLSGYYNVLRRLAALPAALRPRLRPVWSGSHLRSLLLVAAGEVDAAAIDSNVLHHRLAQDPALAARLEVVESWGPFAVQPVVVRAGLDAGLRAAVSAALLEADEVARAALLLQGVERFARVEDADYDPERALLREVNGSACALLTP